MKQKALTLAATAMLTGGFLTGCSSDSIIDNVPEVMERDSQVFLKVRLADAGSESTRGNEDNEDPTNYNYGTSEEMKIHKVLFVFYDALGNYIAHKPLDVTNDNFGKENGSLETILEIIVPVDLKEGQLKPEYVMAYVNPTAKADNELTQAFNRVQTKTRTLEDVLPGDDHNGYTMNNSVYYTGVNSDQPVIASKLPDDALFNSKEEAEAYKEDDKDAIIYVERVVAKVKVTQKDASDKDITKLPQTNNEVTDADTPNQNYTLEFTPLAWGVNNVEPETFLIKNFRKEEVNSYPTKPISNGITNLTYSEANSPLYMGSLTSPSWNYYEPSNNSKDNAKGGHRTFWAYSTTYFDQGDYPENADIYNKNEEDYNFNLTYRSFNDIYDEKGGEDKAGAPGVYGSTLGGNALYTLEHTNRPDVVTKNMQRAVSAVTIVGKYTIKNGDTPLKDGTSFYLERNTSTDGKHKIHVGEDNMKKAFLAENDAVFIKQTKEETAEDGKTTTKVEYYVPVPYDDKSYATYSGDFKVDHPAWDVYQSITEIPVASRYVTLQFADNVKLTDDKNEPKYFIRDGAQYVAVTTGNLKTANQNLFFTMTDNFNPIESFKSGMAYFNVPIKHLWTGTGWNDLGDNDFTAHLGQYGVVRNHLYTINVTGISGIGTGINNPYDPIIPNVPKKQYYVKSEIRVQKWRIVPQQNVTLKP